MKKAVYVSLAAVILLLASSEKFYACSCGFSPEPVKKQVQAAFSAAAAVFSGEVIEIKESPTDKNSFMVKLKVAQVWKGEAKKEITITTAKESAMCGYNFTVGQKYLVYADGAGDALSTSNCSRTTTFSRKSDAKYLAKLKRKKTDSN